MSTVRAKGAVQRGAAAKVAPEEPASSSPATAGTRTSSRTRRAPLAFDEINTNTRTASSASSTAKSSIGKPTASASTTPTSRARSKKAKAAAVPPPVAEDTENDPLPTSRRRVRPQQQQREPSVDSLAELEASYIDDSRVSTVAIPADSSLVQAAQAPAHSTPIASTATATALGANDKPGKQATKKIPFQSLLDEEMLSETDGKLASAKPSGSDDSEEAKTRRQLTENKLERVMSFVGSSGQHRGSSLAPPPIEDYKDWSDERRSKTAGTSEGDQEDEFGFFTVLKKSAANRAKQSIEAAPGASTERVQFEEKRKSASAHEEEQGESSSLASFHPAQPASQASSQGDQDSLQALLRSSPSDLARNSVDKEEIAFSDDDSMDTDDYLFAPQVPRGEKKKPRKKPRRPNPRKGPRVADTQVGSEAKAKGKGKSGVVPGATATTSTTKTGSSPQARKQAVKSKVGSKKKQAEQTPPSEEEDSEGQEEEEGQGSDLPPSSSPGLPTGAKRSRRSAQNSKNVPVPLTAATAAAGSTSAAKPLGTSAAGNIIKAGKPKAKAAGKGKAASSSSSARAKIGAQKARGAKRRQAEDEENEDEDEDDSAGDDDGDDDQEVKAKGREKRLKMYDELDDYALGEEWVI